MKRLAISRRLRSSLLIAVLSCPAYSQIRVRVDRFLPSTSGFSFVNDFPAVPLLYIDVAGIQVPIGSAANGLCGGMSYAVRDYYEAGLLPPRDHTPPASGVLFDYVVKRLFDSFNLPKWAIEVPLFDGP